jgi:hypothetical protein
VCQERLNDWYETSDSMWPKERLYEQILICISFDQIKRYQIQIIKGLVKEVKSTSEKQVESYFILPILLHPQSKGTVKLQSKDPFDPPLIDPKYLTHPQDIKTFLRGIFFFSQVHTKYSVTST